MFEDDAFEASEFWNSRNRQNSYEAAKSVDETKDSGVSSHLPQLRDRFTETYKRDEPANQLNDLNISNAYKRKDAGEAPPDQVNNLNISSTAHVEGRNIKEYQVNPKTQDPHPKTIFLNQSGEVKPEFRKRPIYEIGVHNGKHTQKPSTCENRLASHKTGSFLDRFERMSVTEPVKNEKVSPSEAGFMITTQLIQEVETKGVFISSAGTTPEKTSQNTPLAKEYLKSKTSAASPDKETEKLLDDAIQDFSPRNEYLTFGGSCAKGGKKKMWCGNPTFQGEFVKHPNEMYRNPDIKTLGDSLKYFKLSFQLQQLETSLENLRRNKNTAEQHEKTFKQIDKEIQKLSFKYHPDRVKNQGGTENDVERAQKEQTALNSTRAALKFLNSAFMEDIATDHKFGFYTNLSIESLCNEDEMKQRVYEVIFKIGMISRIKQQNVISEIRKFLVESKRCVDSYLVNTRDFEKQRDLALFHLKCCVKGFKKLYAELKEVKEECESEENGKNMLPLIRKMASESKRDLQILRSLKKTAKASVKGKYRFFSPVEVMDPYFVLPLVSYVNVILMCNVMMRNASIFENIINKLVAEGNPHYRNDLCYLMAPYYLASYCSGNEYHAQEVFKILNVANCFEQSLKLVPSKEDIEIQFRKMIAEINSFMEIKFRVEEYSETMPVNLLVFDLKKCMKMMAEFEAKEQEVSKSLKEFQKKTEIMDEKYAKFDKMMEAAEEMTREYKERVEQNKKISEQFSRALSDQI